MNEAPDVATDDPTATDPDALARLRRFGGTSLLVQMIDLFLVAGPERVSAARAAFTAGDVAGVESALHSLRSSSAQLGGVRMQSLSERGESIARDGTLAGVEPIIAALERELTGMCAWLTATRDTEAA